MICLNSGCLSDVRYLILQLFSFADTHRGKYDSSIPLAKKYYQSTSGYDVNPKLINSPYELKPNGVIFFCVHNSEINVVCVGAKPDL